MFATHSDAIFQMVAAGDDIPVARLSRCRQEASESATPLAEALVADRLLSREELLRMTSSYLGYPLETVVPERVPKEVLAKISPRVAREFGVIPIMACEGRLDVLVADPFSFHESDELTFILGPTVRIRMGDPDQIAGLIHRSYGGESETESDTVGTVKDSTKVGAPDLSLRELAAMAEEAPVVRFVNLVLNRAVRDHASDVHLEPFQDEFKIRYRVDGVLFELAPPDKSLALPITSRLKVLANLDIAERRLPQDGRIAFKFEGRSVDLRISTLPTQFGESVVLRVLDQGAVQLDLHQLGLPSDVETAVREVVERPNGIFVVTGPTGSGKTTTLYSALRLINTPDRKLLTAEDPVEYEIDGLVQVPINPAAGLTFASVLRSFLRQDPDAIMVGEIRDTETARVAIQASLTGHLVLSTLHTNDAASAVTRLIDMGIEPYLIASSLEGVLAQRLVRKICPRCRVAAAPNQSTLDSLGKMATQLAGQQCFHGEGCEHCDHTGFRGRMGIFEWLRVTESIRDLITQRASTADIRAAAREQGMRLLSDDGLRAILAGETTVEEIARCT